LYGEGRPFDEFSASRLFAGEPEHLEGVHGSAAFQISVPYAYEAVGIPRRLEDPPGSLEFPAIEQFVSLAVETDLVLTLHVARRRVGGFDEALAGKALEDFFIHTLDRTV